MDLTTKETDNALLSNIRHIDLEKDWYPEHLMKSDLGRMENVVEDVEDQSESSK